MGLFDFFKTKQQTQGTTASQQQAQQSGQSQSNLWPQLQGYFGNYAQYGTPGPFNQYQLGAANNQTGVAGGLGTAFNTANFGAQGGLYNAGSYQPFMSPYLNDVAMSTLGVQGLQKAQDISALRGNQAVKGALGNNTGAEAAYFAGRAPYDTQAINQIYSQGFNTANQNAQTAAGLGYQGAGLAGQLTGASTGANQALFNQGQTLWSNPLQWMTQWSQGLSPWTQAAGQNYTGQSSGTATGQTNQTTTNQPSPWQILSGLGGLALGFLKDGGAVKGYALGGGVSSFADKVKAAHDVVKQMQSGGEVERPKFAFGGGEPESTMGSLSPGEADWVKDTASANPNGWSWDRFSSALGDASKIGGAAPAPPNVMDALGRQQQGLSQFMAQNNPLQYARGMGYADGGSPTLDWEGTHMPGATAPSAPSYLGARDIPYAAPQPTWQDKLRGMFKGTGYDYDVKPSPIANFSRGLMSASGPLVAGNIAETLGQIEKERMARIAADQHWAQLSGRMPNGQATLAAQTATGNVNGVPTIEARRQALAEAKNPTEIAHIEAQTKLANTQADKEFLLEIEKKKMEYQKALALQQQELEWNQMERILESRRKRLEAERNGPLPQFAPGRYKLNPDGSITPVNPSSGTP